MRTLCPVDLWSYTQWPPVDDPAAGLDDEGRKVMVEERSGGGLDGMRAERERES